MRIRTLLSAIVLVALIVLIVVYQLLGPHDQPQLLLELGKAAIQLIVVGIVGGAIARLWKVQEEDRALAREREEEDRALAREREEEDRALAREREEKRALLVREMRTAYFAAKAARRALKATGFANSTQTKSPSFWDQERLGIYRQQMAELDQAQLLLEGLAVEVGLWPEAFSQPTLLGQRIATMENALRKVTKEYERSGLALSGSASQYTGHPGVLVGFLAFVGPDGFGATVVEPYREALRAAKPELKPASAFRKQEITRGGMTT